MAKVLTERDVHILWPAGTVWLEVYGGYAAVQFDVEWVSRDEMRIGEYEYKMTDYNRSWRIWDSKPTVKERKDAKWDLM